MNNGKIEHLASDDVLILLPEQNNILQCCCACGEWHNIHISRHTNGEIHFQFERLGERPNLSEIHTEVLRQNGIKA